jgi:hypothetical protein
VTAAAVGSGVAIGSTAANWFTGGAASVVRTPSNVDLSVEMQGTGRLFFDSGANSQAWRGSQWLFYSSSTALGLTIVPGLASTMTGGATSWTLDAPAIINIGTVAATSIKIGRSGQSLGFYGNAAITRSVVSGSRSGGGALTNLLTALANLGLITDSTSA